MDLQFRPAHGACKRASSRQPFCLCGQMPYSFGVQSSSSSRALVSGCDNRRLPSRERLQQTAAQCGRAVTLVRCDATGAASDGSIGRPVRPPELERSSSKGTLLIAGLGMLAVTAAALLHQQGYSTVARDYIARTSLGKSGFPAAFSLIFLSEIGDKTFFIAALLAAKFSRWLSFSASVLSLTVMTIISVGIGRSLRGVPEFLQSGLPIGEWAGAALLIYFGIRTLKDAWDTPDDADGDELAGAQGSIDAAEQSGKMVVQTQWQAFVQVATLIFLAEWGDRSMLATIVLAVSQNPIGVGGGAIVGHAAATMIAVIGGAIASKYISEKTIGYIGGSLFLAFAAATLLGVC